MFLCNEYLEYGMQTVYFSQENQCELFNLTTNMIQKTCMNIFLLFFKMQINCANIIS